MRTTVIIKCNEYDIQKVKAQGNSGRISFKKMKDKECYVIVLPFNQKEYSIKEDDDEYEIRVKSNVLYRRKGVSSSRRFFGHIPLTYMGAEVLLVPVNDSVLQIETLSNSDGFISQSREDRKLFLPDALRDMPVNVVFGTDKCYFKEDSEGVKLVADNLELKHPVTMKNGLQFVTVEEASAPYIVFPAEELIF